MVKVRLSREAHCVRCGDLYRRALLSTRGLCPRCREIARRAGAAYSRTVKAYRAAGVDEVAANLRGAAAFKSEMTRLEKERVE